MTAKPRATSKSKAKAEPDAEPVEPIELDAEPVTFSDGSAPADPVADDRDPAEIVRAGLDQLAMTLVGSPTTISGDEIADLTTANADIDVIQPPDPYDEQGE